jgi:hypothetical protein
MRAERFEVAVGHRHEINTRVASTVRPVVVTAR